MGTLHFSGSIKKIGILVAVLSTSLGAGAVMSNPANAQSAEAKTEVNFSVQPFVRLYYRDAVNISLNPKPDAAAVNTKGAAEVSATYALEEGISGAGNVGLEIPKLNPQGKVELQNFWAVQSIAPKATQVNLKVVEAKACNPDFGECIVINDVGGSENFEPTGLMEAHYGNATLALDMSSVRHSGKFTGAVIYISAENL